MGRFLMKTLARTIAIITDLGIYFDRINEL